MSRTTLTVFLCSTYSDLSAEREAVLQTVRKLRLQHDSMEFFGARAAQPIETCLAEVRRSDVLVVIVGYKYGELVPGKTISFTEAEYSEGYDLGKPCLIYLRDENVPILPAHMERNPEKLQALERFKELLKARHTVATFKDANDLAVSVAADLSRTLQAESPSAEQYRGLWTAEWTADTPSGEHTGEWSLSISADGEVTGKEEDYRTGRAAELSGLIDKDGYLKLLLEYPDRTNTIKGTVIRTKSNRLKGTLIQYAGKEAVLAFDIELLPT